MAKLLGGILLFLSCTCPLTAAERYIVPHAVAGSPIYMQNATNDMEVVKVLDQYVFVMPMTTEHVVASGTGSVVLDSSGPLLTWSVVDGVTFIGMAPARQITLTVTPRTGLAFANDREEQLTITIEVYRDMQLVKSLDGGFAPKSSLALWMDELFPDLGPGEYTLVLRSDSGHIAAGAARLENGRFQTVPAQVK